MAKSKPLVLFIAVAFVLAVIAGAQQKPGDTAVDPVCGMTVNKTTAKVTYDYKGTTYYFCGQGCKDAFAKDPEKYLQKSQQKPSASAVDPVCGMTVNKTTAKVTYDYKGTTYYFCCQGCKDAFAKDPEKYLQKKSESQKPAGACTCASPGGCAMKNKDKK
jgi:Cu+-exporting ATPase